MDITTAASTILDTLAVDPEHRDQMQAITELALSTSWPVIPDADAPMWDYITRAHRALCKVPAPEYYVLHPAQHPDTADLGIATRFTDRMDAFRAGMPGEVIWTRVASAWQQDGTIF